MMEAKTVTYQCPNCNAALEYDNAGGKFRCYYCDSIFDEQQIKQLFTENEQLNLDENEPELTDEQKQAEEFADGSALYSCPNCGASVICDSLTSSTRCHFCHTPVILSGRLSGDYKPDVIIPFSRTREQAESSFKEYIKGKFLLPKGFRSQAQINNISALYVPYWFKSGITNADMTAQGKIVRTWRSGDTTYTNTKIYHVERHADLAFIRVPCDGSKRIDDAMMESIEPFNYTGLKPFSMSFLSGCAAEKYDVTSDDAAKRIDERIKMAAEEVLKKDASNYTKLENVQTSVRFAQSQYVYALLPVWFLNYSFMGKDYPFVMNGQTGKSFGILPVSKLKAALFTLGVFALTALIVCAIGGACFALA